MPTEPNFFDRKLILLIILLLGTLVAYPADIRPNDYATPSYIAFELDGYVVSEDSTNLVVTVYRMGDFRTSVSVDYILEEGTATAGKDFKGMGGTIVFPGGQSFKTISIPIHWDEDSETDENFIVQLSNPSPNAEIVQVEAPITIKDCAQVPRISIATGQGIIVLSWQPNGKTFALQRCIEPSRASWETVVTEPSQVDGKLVVEEQVSNTFYFYRLQAKAE